MRDSQGNGGGQRPIWIVAAICALVLLAGFLLAREGGGTRIGELAAVGFLVPVAVLLIANALRALLARPEDYYDG